MGLLWSPFMRLLFKNWCNLPHGARITRSLSTMQYWKLRVEIPPVKHLFVITKRHRYTSKHEKFLVENCGIAHENTKEHYACFVVHFFLRLSKPSVYTKFEKKHNSRRSAVWEFGAVGSVEKDQWTLRVYQGLIYECIKTNVHTSIKQLIARIMSVTTITKREQTKLRIRAETVKKVLMKVKKYTLNSTIAERP